LTNVVFQTNSRYKHEYNKTLGRIEFKWFYAQRKSSVEPVFSLIKELFDLKGESQLSYKGIAKVVLFFDDSLLDRSIDDDSQCNQ